MERFTRRSVQSATAPAIKLIKIDAAQENLVQQQENERMSAQPKVSQSEPSSENSEKLVIKLLL